MLRRFEGSLAEGGVLDVEEAADVQHGKARSKEAKRRKVDLQGIRRDITAAEVAAATLKEERHRATAVDVTAFAESSAGRKGRKKTEEHITADDTKGFIGFFRKAFRRQTASGQEDKFRKQAAEEIFKRGHLAESKEKSYEIVDEALESVENASMRAAGENPELYTGAGGARLDALGAELLTAWVLGDCKTRDGFDLLFNQRILPEIGAVSGKKIDGKIYGNSFFHVAEGYKKQFEEKLELTADLFGPEQKAIVRTYLNRVFRMDVTLAKKGADLYEMKADSAVLRGMEKFINWTQSPIMNVPFEKLKNKIYDTNFAKSKVGKKIDRAVAFLSIGNPVFHAYLGGRIAAATASGLGVGTVKALGIGATVAVGMSPGMAVAIGAAAGAGFYLGIRQAVEHWRGIKRRHEQAALGQAPEETSQRDARMAATRLYEITNELGSAGVLTSEQQSEAARIIATLETQDKLKKNLFKVGEGEGAEYDTNYLGVQDLRRAIKNFKGVNNSRGNPLNIDTLVAKAEKEVITKLREREKELLGEIKSAGLWGGVKGAGMVFAAACLLPGLKQAAEVGWNKFMDMWGISKLHFDTSKISFTEEIWHNVKEKLRLGEHYKLYDPGEGMQRMPMGTVSGKTGHYFDIPDNQHLGDLQFVRSPDAKFLIVSQGGKDFIKIPIDADGNVTDEAPLMKLRDMFGWKVDKLTEPVAGAPGTAGNRADWMSQMKSTGGREVGVAEVHTKGLYTNEFANTSDLNELRLHITQRPNGDILIDSNNLLQNGSFRVVGDNIEHPDMFDLRAKGELKYVFIPDAANPNDAIILDMDSSGNFIVPKGSKAYDLFDPTTGKVRSGVLYGTARVQTGAKGLDLYWLNSDKNTTGLGMDYGGGVAGAPATEQLAGYRLRPPVYHGFGGPIALAGDRRRTDADVMSEREKRAEEKKKPDRQAFRKQMLQEHPEAEERLVMAQAELAERIKNGELAEVVFNDVVDKYVLENDPERQEILFRRACAALGMTEAQIAVAMLSKKQAFEASHAAAAAGGSLGSGSGSASGGGGGGAHGAETRGTSQPAAAAAIQRPQFNQKAGWLSILTDRQREIRNPQQKADRRELLDITRSQDAGLYMEFDADDSLLVDRNFVETVNKAREVYALIRAENLDPNFYRGKKGTAFKIKFSENGPYEAVPNDNDNSVSWPFAPDRSAVSIVNAILQRLRAIEGANGELKHPLESPDRTVLDQLNNEKRNQKPHLEFEADDELLRGEDRTRVNNLAKGIFYGFNAAGLRKRKYNVGEVRLKISKDGAGAADVQNGSLIVPVKLTDSPISVLSKLENLLVEQEKEKKPERRRLSRLNASASNKEPHLVFDVADDELLKGDEGKQVADLARQVLKRVDASDIRGYQHRDTIIRIEMRKNPPYTVHREEGYITIPVNYKDPEAVIFSRVRKELSGEPGEVKQPKEVEDINKDPNNKEPSFHFILDSETIRKTKPGDIRTYLSALHGLLRANPDVVRGRFKDAIVQINLVKPSSSTVGQARKSGGVMVVDISADLMPDAVQRLVVEGMKSVEDREVRLTGVKGFLKGINDADTNREPHIGYGISDVVMDKMLGSEGEAAVKAKLNAVKAKIDAKLVELKTANPLFKSRLVKVDINDSGNYHYSENLGDGSWQINLPFDQPINALEALIDQQAEAIKRARPLEVSLPDLSFLAEMNDYPGNTNPNVKYDMSPVAARILGSSEKAKDYMEFIQKVFSDHWDILKSTGELRNRQFYERKNVTILIDKRPKYEAKISEVDGSWLFVIPPDINPARVSGMIDDQKGQLLVLEAELARKRTGGGTGGGETRRARLRR